jgi:hypothetical protein
MSNKLHPFEYNQRVRTLSAIIWIVLIASSAPGLLNVQFRTWDSMISLFSLTLICIPPALAEYQGALYPLRIAFKYNRVNGYQHQPF